MSREIIDVLYFFLYFGLSNNIETLFKSIFLIAYKLHYGTYVSLCTLREPNNYVGFLAASTVRLHEAIPCGRKAQVKLQMLQQGNVGISSVQLEQSVHLFRAGAFVI